MAKIIRLIAIASLLIVAACSSKVDSQENISAAADYGHRHAELLINAQPDILSMQTILLETRAHEEELRQAGHVRAADAYIEAFENHIREHDRALAKEIL